MSWRLCDRFIFWPPPTRRRDNAELRHIPTFVDRASAITITITPSDSSIGPLETRGQRQDNHATVIGGVAQVQTVRHDLLHFRPGDLLPVAIFRLSAFHLLAGGSPHRLGIRTAECATEGSNMLCYGWSVTTVPVAGALGIIAMILPEPITKKLAIWPARPLPTLAIR
jgi:hypothetical protein